MKFSWQSWQDGKVRNRHVNVSRDTIRKWRQRDTVADASYTAHRLQTTLNPAQEELVIYLRSQAAREIIMCYHITFVKGHFPGKGRSTPIDHLR